MLVEEGYRPVTRLGNQSSLRFECISDPLPCSDCEESGKANMKDPNPVPPDIPNTCMGGPGENTDPMDLELEEKGMNHGVDNDFDMNQEINKDDEMCVDLHDGGNEAQA
ncbi:hypothetical protein PIB30_061440 [Stylosanthes scabra]|uniref:Uncharacterized protein n=1 Tax=Stylosanthes scabra TaxID=79078 RepID=A0ABU6QKG8_9FABA|nr:hypothetical protein [Stylosanthes scabra]